MRTTGFIDTGTGTTAAETAKPAAVANTASTFPWGWVITILVILAIIFAIYYFNRVPAVAAVPAAAAPGTA